MHSLDRYNLFIFDWDGTLSTTPTFDFITKRITPRYHMTYIKRRERYYLQQTAENIRLEREEEAGHSLFSALYDAYSVFLRPKLMPGALELLSILKKKHKKVAVFSDGRQYRLIKEVHDLGIAKYIDYLLSAEAIRSYKPSPIGIQFIIRQMHSSRDKAVYIGDFTSDVLTSKFAGVDSCAVAAGISTFEELKRMKPDNLFRNLAEMQKQLTEHRR